MDLWRTYRRPPDLLWRLALKCKGERQEEAFNGHTTVNCNAAKRPNKIIAKYALDF